MLNLEEILNSNKSVLGQEIIDWINSDKSTKDEYQRGISNKLYHKYLFKKPNDTKPKIFPDVYYYVNYNNHLNPDMHIAYIVRDKAKSPRRIPDSLIALNIVDSHDSYKGSIIQEWAYYQNSSSENPYYMDGCDIVTKYLESSHPIHKGVYYYANRMENGSIKLFRDLKKSPRKEYTDTTIE